MSRSITESHPDFKRIQILVTMNHQLRNVQCWYNLGFEDAEQPDKNVERVAINTDTPEFRATLTEITTDLESALAGDMVSIRLPSQAKEANRDSDVFGKFVNGDEINWGRWEDK